MWFISRPHQIQPRRNIHGGRIPTRMSIAPHIALRRRLRSHGTRGLPNLPVRRRHESWTKYTLRRGPSTLREQPGGPNSPLGKCSGGPPVSAVFSEEHEMVPRPIARRGAFPPDRRSSAVIDKPASAGLLTQYPPDRRPQPDPVFIPHLGIYKGLGLVEYYIKNDRFLRY